MKTYLLPCLMAAVTCPLFSQNDLASANGVPPHEPAAKTTEFSSAEPSIAAFPNTINEVAVIGLERPFRKPVTLQVISPAGKMLLEQTIPAGQTRIRVDLHDLPDGAYTFRLHLGAKMWVKQITKG